MDPRIANSMQIICIRDTFKAALEAYILQRDLKYNVVAQILLIEKHVLLKLCELNVLTLFHSLVY